MHDNDTIVAHATGLGRAALAIIRISGARTRFVLETVAGRVPEPRRLVRASLHDPATSLPLDDGMIVFFPSPASATGEDVAELHVHGGLAVVGAILRVLTGLPGVRLAEPGEFTRRAVLAGKMDLTAAEALADLIEAETEVQRHQALRQLSGGFASIVEGWRGRLLDALALMEAELDFSDEDDVGTDLVGQALAEARSLARDIRKILDDRRCGERVRDGFAIVIAGPPNAGKSTLLNHLAGREVAIVSPYAGTTRDVLEVRCDLAGLPVVLTDTAGLRETSDPVETEGVARALRQVDAADLVLWLSADDATDTIAERPTGSLLVRTKADLGGPFPADALVVSAATGEGIDGLLEAITKEARASIGGESALITRARHREALQEVQRALIDAIDSGPKPIEFLAEDLRRALLSLGRITGDVGAEDVLDRIFSSFCIGK